MDRQANGALRQLVRRIEAVPFQAIEGTLVVLRARIYFDLRPLIPVDVRRALTDLYGDAVPEFPVPETIVPRTLHKSILACFDPFSMSYMHRRRTSIEHCTPS